MDYYSTSIVSGVTKQVTSDAQFYPYAINSVPWTTINGTNIYWTSEIYIDFLQAMANYIYRANRQPIPFTVGKREYFLPNNLMAVGTNFYNYYATPTNVVCPFEEVISQNKELFKFYDINMLIQGGETNINVPYLFVQNVEPNKDIGIYRKTWSAVVDDYTRWSNYVRPGIFARFQTTDNQQILALSKNAKNTISLSYSDRINATISTNNPVVETYSYQPILSSYYFDGIAGKAIGSDAIQTNVFDVDPFYKVNGMSYQLPVSTYNTTELYYQYNTNMVMSGDVVLEPYGSFKYNVTNINHSTLLVYSNMYSVFSNVCNMTDYAFIKEGGAYQIDVVSNWYYYGFATNAYVGSVYDDQTPYQRIALQDALDIASAMVSNVPVFYRQATYFDADSWKVSSHPKHTWGEVKARTPSVIRVICDFGYPSFYTNHLADSYFVNSIYVSRGIFSIDGPQPFYDWANSTSVASNIYPLMSTPLVLQPEDLVSSTSYINIARSFPLPADTNWFEQTVTNTDDFVQGNYMQEFYPYLERKDN